MMTPRRHNRVSMYIYIYMVVVTIHHMYETVYCDDLTSSHYTSSWMTEYIIYGENNEKDENVLD